MTTARAPAKKQTRAPAPKRGSHAAAPASARLPKAGTPTRSALYYIAEMVGIAAGIYVCFFAWGVVHEKVATHDYVVSGKHAKFNFHVVTTLVGACCTMIVALTGIIFLAFLKRPVRRVPIDVSQLALVGLTLTFATPLGLTAAKHLSYPVYLTVKMCKMVPTVIIGALWHRFRYSTMKIMATTLITAGVLSFSLLSDKSDAHAAANSPGSDDVSWSQQTTTTIVAVIMCFIAMSLDGYTNSTQDAINRKSPNLHPLQLMLGLSMSVSFWCTISLFFTEYMIPESLRSELLKPELWRAATFIAQQPQALQDLMLLGLLNALGQIFIYTGLGIFGSLTVMAISTTRKIGSVFISIAVHGHTVTLSQWAALGTVVVGVVCDAWDGVQKHTSSIRHNKPKNS